MLLRRRSNIAEAAKWPNKYLKVVEILGYRPKTCVIQHIKFLIDSVVGWEKIVIYPVGRWCRPKGSEGEVEPKREAKERDHATQQLKI